MTTADLHVDLCADGGGRNTGVISEDHHRRLSTIRWNATQAFTGTTSEVDTPSYTSNVVDASNTGATAAIRIYTAAEGQPHCD